MSEEDSNKPSVCINFEPQAWRKTVCKNCFQSPAAHAAGSGENGVSVSSGNVKQEGTSSADKKSAATSLKNKYEQLEKDKYKPKDASHTLPRTKKASGLTLITDKYDQLDKQVGMSESPTKSIPPPTPPKTYKKDGSMKGKFGSMENVSAEVEVSDNKLGLKFKFGSMENISQVPEKKKDSVSSLTQKSKFGGSVDNISSVDRIKDGRQAMLNKLDSFQNEIKSGATSKAGQTVIHQQKDGQVDIITLPKRSTDTKIKDSSPQSKELVIKLNEKTEPKSKFEKPDLKLTNNKDKENIGLSKTGQKSKFDLKSTTSETEKQNELKGAKDLLSSNRLKTIKTEDSKEKEKSADKDLKSGWKKPELKPASNDNKETKPISFKDRLNKTTEVESKDKLADKDTKPGFKKPELKSSVGDKEETKPSSFKDRLNKTSEKSKLEESKDSKDKPIEKDLKLGLKKPDLKPASKDKDDTKPTSLKDRLNRTGDGPKKDEPSKSSLNLKDQLKSPSTDKDKLKDQLKSPSADKDKLKDDLKSPSQNKGNLRDQLKSPSTDKDKLKDVLKSSSVDKDPLSKLKDKLKSPTPENDNKQAPSWKDRLKSPAEDTEKKVDDRSKSPKGDTKLDSELKPDLSRKNVTAVEREKSKSPISIEKKQVTDTENTVKKSDVPPTKHKDEMALDKNTTISKVVDRSKSTPEETSKLDKETGLSKPEPALDRENAEQKSNLLLTEKKEEVSNVLNRTGKESVDKSKSTTVEKSKLDNDTKVQDKSTNDLKSKFNKTNIKTGKEEDTTSKPKPFNLRNSLKKAEDKPNTDKDPVKLDTKKKFELPSLKSNKTTSIVGKSNNADNKANSTDVKPSDKFGNKFKLNKTNEPKSNVPEEKTSTKAKFELPKLKSKTEQQDDPKSSLKSKFEPKSKLNETKTDSKNKFEIPNLKKLKSPEVEQVNDKNNSLKTKDNKDSLKLKEKTSDVVIKSSKDAEKSTNELKASTKVDSDYDFQKKKETNKGESRDVETSKEICLDKNAPETSGISTTTFGTVSSDSEVVSGDACAEKSTRDSKSPLHVDTQVFTSSRSKTAGVSSLDDSNFDDNTSGFSGLGLTKSNKTKSPPKDKVTDTLVNGDIALEHYECSKKETKDNEKAIGSKYSDGELERLKAELLNMTERCQNLETENEMLRSDLNKKALTESTAKKQRDEVEGAINGLKSQLKSMEDKCSQLESENINMMNDLKAKHETNQIKPHIKESEEMDDKLTAKEKLMEDLMEENDQLKLEINELKVEMEEMYDSFRDQEAEEFREIQKELEYTAKNCRILQFKLRKMERRNEQTEKDKSQFEERLRKLQNSFQDRDAVSHIHSLEDELRLAKEVSVRLHDELDLMEDRRGKVEEENRHLTELLEQADRKQFRLELEVDKLRDKVVELRQELRLREGGADPNEPRKVTLETVGKQTSLEHEITELKRELYDGKERELDLKDQLQFVETNGNKLQKKVRDLEEENDNLSRQIKKLSLQRSSNVDTTKANDKKAIQEAEVEVKIQLELSEKELSVLKKNMSAMDEENELLHRELFQLEKRLKDQERQLSIIPEPSSPRSYYEDKIKGYEKEANDFRSKLLDKENEIERLYAQIQSQSGRGTSLRKSRSLDLESDYHLVVDLRRQVEMCNQENEALKSRIEYLKEDKSCLMDELTAIRNNVNDSEKTGLSGLAVAFIETEDEEKLKNKLQEMETSRALIIDKIGNTVKNIQSLNESHLPNHFFEQKMEIAKTPNSDVIIESCAEAVPDNTPSSGVEITSSIEQISGNSCESIVFTASEKQLTPGKYHCTLSDAEVSDSVQTINVSRDIDKLLSILENNYSVLVKRLSDSCAEMISDDGKVVPSEPEGVDGHSKSPGEEIAPIDKGTNDSVLIDTKMSEFSEKLAIEIIQSVIRTDDQATVNDERECEKELSSDSLCKISEMDTEQEEEVVPLDEISADDNVLSRKYYKDKILYLEEEVDDLRMIIKSKEEKSVLLEDEVEELQTYVKKVQDDSRRRELELLSEMDLIHGKNEILNNLLEIVQDRAEAAEDELERVITEINEAQDSSSISSEKSNNSTAPARDSDGSDDVFEGSPVDKNQVTAFWEEQFKKRIRSLETLLAEERKKSSSLIKQLEINSSDIVSSAMSDDTKLHMREKELLQSELHESQKHAVLANDQIRSLTEKLKKVETERWRSPKLKRKPQGSASSDDTSSDGKQESYCRTCADLQTVKNQLSDELLKFKAKAEELEIKIEEINEIWISKSAASEREKQGLEQKLAQKSQDVKRLEDQINKLREEDRMKDIFMKERDNNLKEKTAQITRKDEIIQEQEDIIRQREEDLQSLFDQISQREKTIKELSETVRVKEERIKERENALSQLSSSIEEKNEELHYLEEEVHESVLKRKESESMIVELQTKIEETLKVEKTEIETENERLQSDIENLMGNITELHTDKVTLQNELDKAKHALSEAMLMWERDRSTLGAELSICREKMRLMQETAEKKESQALQMLRREVHSIIESREKLVHELRLNKMEHENTVRILKTEKFKLTEELTSKIRMLTHEMNNNDKMSDELTKLRGQDDINYQLHHHEKILRAEYMAMKVRYETQLDRLQKEHMQLLEVVLKLQKEKNLDQEIIQGIQRGMANIKQNYTVDLSRWKDERNVLESHISQIEEGKEIAQHLRAQIDALKRQLTDQDVERTDLVNKMTNERRHWDIEHAQQTSKINQLEEQLAIFVQAQSKSKDVQYRMEVAWEKERAEQKRLLNDAHAVAMDLQEQLSRRDEENAREKKNLLEQLDKRRKDYDDEKMSREKMSLEMNTGETRVKHLEKQMDDIKERQKKEQDSWTKEKGELLRRLAEMRKLHLRDVRRIDDVLAALKRLRELATIVIDSENSAMLPSNGNDDNVRCGDASAASASDPVHSHENDSEMTDLKQNIDQVILKYVKESLRQIHFLTEELARPSSDLSREEKQTLRRSLSSSEIELLKDEFLLGPQESGRVIPEVKSSDSGREYNGLQRQITHDGTTITSDRVQPDYIDNILMEQSSFYNDAKDAHIEVHRVKTTRDITRVETKVTSLPKPPPSFIIPRSRSTSPAPSTMAKGKQTKPVLKSMSLETSHSHRLSAPITGASSKNSSTDSSPVGPFNFIPTSEGVGLGVAGNLQSGSLDRLSPSTARKRFFEAQPNTSASFMSWPDRRKRELNPNRNSRSLTGSTELYISESNDDISGNGKLRNSVSMDDGSISVEPRDTQGVGSSGGAVARSRSAENTSKHSGLRDMFIAMKKRLRPKVKRSQSAREHDKIQKLQAVKENENADKNDDVPNEYKSISVSEISKLKSDSSLLDDAHVTQDQLTPINIPDDDTKQRTSRTSDRGKKNKSRSRSPASDKDDSHGSQSTLQRIKNRFRSKSADRARDHREHHVTPILVGHTTTAQAEDQQYSETCV